MKYCGKYNRHDEMPLYKELFGNMVKEEIFHAPYFTPHRFYHNFDHILENEKQLSIYFAGEENVPETYILANLFHDICYNPTITDNELASAELFLNSVLDKTHPAVQVIYDLIMSTKNPPNRFVNPLVRADWEYLYSTDPEKIREIERKIFKEYQFCELGKYIKGRTEFLLAKADSKYFNIAKNYYIGNYNVAIYAGSFNPMHIGHQSIIEQAEQIFDKVIIAVGKNPEKVASNVDSVIEAFPFHQVVSYDTLLTDLINKYEKDNPNCKFTLIRGLRNGFDLNMESNQIEYMRIMKPDLKVTLFLCEKAREHISSSSIKALAQFNKKESERYLVKKYKYFA